MEDFENWLKTKHFLLSFCVKGIGLENPHDAF